MIAKSLGAIQSCQVAYELYQLIENSYKEAASKKVEEVEGLMEDIRQLAKKYWILEAKTKRSVRDIKAYGKYLKQAAEDYLENGDLGDLMVEMSDMKVVKKSLHEANEKHEEIRGNVIQIEKRAETHLQTCEDKAAVKMNSLIRIPFDGLIDYILLRRTDKISDMIEKEDWSELCMYAGKESIKALVSLPVWLGYTAFQAYMIIKDAKVYAKVKPQFEGILVQMGTIHTHLDTILNSISNIEDRLNNSIRTGEKAMQVELSDEKRKKMV